MSALSEEQIAYQTAHIDEDRRSMVMGVTIAMIVLATTSVVLRFIARAHRRMEFGWDDWFCVPALVLTLCTCAVNIISVRYGMGRHLLATDLSQGYKILQAGYFLSLAYSWTHFFLKFAILLTYIRFFGLRVTWFKWAVYAGFLWVTLWTIAPTIVVLAQCRPISYFWQRFNIARQPPAVGTCTANTHHLAMSMGILNIVVDVYLLILPMTMIWRLNLNTAKKIGVTSIFLIGTFVCIASILRIVSTVHNWENESDSTWDSVGVYIWTCVEAAVGLACACFPVLGPLFVAVSTKVGSYITSSTSSGSTGWSNSGGDGSNGYRVKTDRPWKRFKGNNLSQEVGLSPLSNKQGGISRTDEYTVTSSV